MNEKYKNKYRIASARLQNWDYGWSASYFITICTKNRAHYFGEIVGGEMKLSPIGVIADIIWYEIKNHSKNVKLGEFIVMPNHIHGILTLNNDGMVNDVTTDVDDVNDVGDVDNVDNVETRHALSLPQLPPPPPKQKTIGQKRFQNQGKNTISSITGSYKSAVTKHARRLGFEFAWQTRFWDHIIRSEDEYSRIEQYIMNNPMKWERDKLNGGKGNVVLEEPGEYNSEIWMV